jgi:ankyrin repeat protein
MNVERAVNALRPGRVAPPLGVFLAAAVLFGCARPPDEAEAVKPALATDDDATSELERIRRALEQGLDVDEADADGRTRLMSAAFDGQTDVVTLLLEHGAEVDRRDPEGRTALMFGASGPFPGTVELLLRHGADVNAIDSAEGWTALMWAASEGQQPVVELLLGHGADRQAADQDGERAIDHARKRGQSHIVALLEGGPGSV